MTIGPVVPTHLIGQAVSEGALTARLVFDGLDWHVSAGRLAMVEALGRLSEQPEYEVVLPRCKDGLHLSLLSVARSGKVMPYMMYSPVSIACVECSPDSCVLILMTCELCGGEIRHCLHVASGELVVEVGGERQVVGVLRAESSTMMGFLSGTFGLAEFNVLRGSYVGDWSALGVVLGRVFAEPPSRDRQTAYEVVVAALGLAMLLRHCD